MKNTHMIIEKKGEAKIVVSFRSDSIKDAEDFVNEIIKIGHKFNCEIKDCTK